MTDLTIITEADLALPAEPLALRHYIDGAWRDSADGAVSERIAPSHGVTVSLAAKGGVVEADAAIDAARRAFDDGRWSRISGKERAAVLLRVADLIEENTERFALIETLETGKPISQARGEVGGLPIFGVTRRPLPAPAMATATTRLAPTCWAWC